MSLFSSNDGPETVFVRITPDVWVNVFDIAAVTRVYADEAQITLHGGRTINVPITVDQVMDRVSEGMRQVNES